MSFSEIFNYWALFLLLAYFVKLGIEILLDED